MSAADRHQSSGWKLVLRADICSSPDVNRKPLYYYAVFFYRDAAHAETPVPENTSYRHISRIFNGHMDYIHHFKYPGQMIYELLCARTDHHLLLSADHSS